MMDDNNFSIATETEVEATMRDGTILRADIFRPEAPGRFPVLLTRTPYDKRRPWPIEVSQALARCGYVTVIQDIRGRYASEGEFVPFYITEGRQDAADGYDSIEWCATLPYSDGQVGTWGISYPSALQWDLAPLRPPHLKAMFTGGLGPDSRSTWPGIFRTGRQLQWNLVSFAPDTRRRQGLPGPKTVEAAQTLWDLEGEKWYWFLPMAEFSDEALGGMKRWWPQWLGNHHEDWFGYSHLHHEVDVPVYHFTGWYDRLVGTVDHYTGMVQYGRTEATRRHQKLIVGPWTHTYPYQQQVGDVDFGRQADMDLAALIRRWFDYWLKGEQNGIMQEAPVRLFVMGENCWRDEESWPLARTQYTEFFLHSQGQANTPAGNGTLSQQSPQNEPNDQYTYDPRDPVPSTFLPNAHDAPLDQRILSHRQDILVYQTSPLEEALEVTGPIQLKLFASSTALDTDWMVKLIDVYPDGFAQNLCYGVLRAKYRDGWDQSALLGPNKIYEYTVEVQPTSNLFQIGHRLRVDITSSDFPNFDRNHNTGRDYWDDAALKPAQQTIWHDRDHPSRIILPVIPRRKNNEFKKGT